MQRKLAKRLISARMRRGLSQREVAVRAGFRQPYLAQVERGVRPISARALARLEDVYQVQFGKLSAGVGRRGRPAYTPQTKRGLREFCRGIRDFWGRGVIAAPEHEQPHQVRRSDDPLWTIALRLDESAAQEVKELEILRREDDLFWRQFNSLRFDSWSEKRLLVRVGLLGGQMLGFRLGRLGCSLAVVNGVTGESAGLHRGYMLAGKSMSVVWCPQVAVATRMGVLCLDNLLLVSARGRTVTVGVEVNGAVHHGDLDARRQRDSALGIPILHLDAGELGRPGLIRRILCWAREQLAAQEVAG